MKKEETADKTAPTKESIMAFLRDQIQVKKLEAELQGYNTRITMDRLEEVKALQQMAQYTAGQSTNPADNPNLVQHVVTQNDIDTIPEFTTQGFTVGMTVGIPKEVYGMLYPQKAEAQAEAMSVVED